MPGFVWVLGFFYSNTHSQDAVVIRNSCIRNDDKTGEQLGA